MIALGGPKLKPAIPTCTQNRLFVSMIALGGPKLKHVGLRVIEPADAEVSMIALGGPKLKHLKKARYYLDRLSFNDSTGWA